MEAHHNLWLLTFFFWWVLQIVFCFFALHEYLCMCSSNNTKCICIVPKCTCTANCVCIQLNNHLPHHIFILGGQAKWNTQTSQAYKSEDVLWNIGDLICHTFLCFFFFPYITANHMKLQWRRREDRKLSIVTLYVYMLEIPLNSSNYLYRCNVWGIGSTKSMKVSVEKKKCKKKVTWSVVYN